jgi:hypothetical protein
VPDGSFTLPVEGGLRLRLSVSGGKADLRETNEKAAELPAKLPSAARFLFSADYAAGSPLIAANPFLQSLLPLPLSFETADEV